MKKILLVCTVCMFALAGNVFAQSAPQISEIVITKVQGKDPKGKTMDLESFSWGASNASGAQTVKLPNRRGTLKYVKTGDKFSDVVFIDAAGKSHRMTPTPQGTNGAPSPSCKYPIPDACFGTADKNIGMCMCKPTDLNSNSPYTVALLLPAVQKVREAAARIQ